MNKPQSLAAILVATVVATQAASHQSAIASTISITCDRQSGTPTIIASFLNQGRTENITLLNFLPEYFSPQAAAANCQSTASALQSLYSADNIKYLASDTLNGNPVVCAVERRGIGCDSRSAKVLFTLDQKADPSQVLYKMLGENFKQSQPLATRTVSRIYTDIKPFWWPFK